VCVCLCVRVLKERGRISGHCTIRSWDIEDGRLVVRNLQNKSY
jgi:hypothetical protein